MKWRTLFLLLPISISSPVSISAQHSSDSTQTALASMFQRPNWTDADRNLLLLRAERGDVEAQLWLGIAYEDGRFGKKNFHEALKWLIRAAEQNDPDAQVCLGQMYAQAWGVHPNFKLAVKWYRKAAEHAQDFGGAGQGRNELGLLYMDGLGVPKDYVQAYMWFRLTGRDTNLSFAKDHLTSAQVLEAERMATVWKDNHPER